jgi:hypothetical protein
VTEFDRNVPYTQQAVDLPPSQLMNTFWVLLILMVYACGPPCESVFTNQRGLTNHRHACAIYRRTETHAAVQRKERLERKKAKQISRNISGRAGSLGPALNTGAVRPFQPHFQ